MIRRAGRLALILAVCLAAALLARPGSVGAKVRSAADAYLHALSKGDLETAHSMLGDSLASRISPPWLTRIAPDSPASSGRLTGRDGAGYLVGFPGEDGSSRTLLITLAGDSARVAADSRLEGVLGRAVDACVEYARAIVAPAVIAGAAAEEYACPVTGRPYRLSDDGRRLICAAGHLSEGIALSRDQCAARRDSLATLASRYHEETGSMPGSFGEIYAELSLPPRERVGYSCPADANALYRLEADSTIYCPYHGQATAIEVRR